MTRVFIFWVINRLFNGLLFFAEHDEQEWSRILNRKLEQNIKIQECLESIILDLLKKIQLP